MRDDLAAAEVEHPPPGGLKVPVAAVSILHLLAGAFVPLVAVYLDSEGREGQAGMPGRRPSRSPGG
jgi:hypothetical protein